MTPYSKLTATLKERLSCLVLYPFYVAVVIYFIIFQPCFVFPPPSWTAAIFKAIPVWILIIYVRLSAKGKRKNFIPKSIDHQNMILGLLFTSIGDIFFIFDNDLMEDGMICFAVAQFYYGSVIKQDITKSRISYIFMFCGLVTFSFVLNNIDDKIMDAFVFFYLSLIYTIGWRSTCRLKKEGVSLSTVLSSLGSILFIFSDTLRAANKWSWRIAVVDFLCMLCYYTALLSYTLTLGSVKTDLQIEKRFYDYFGFESASLTM